MNGNGEILKARIRLPLEVVQKADRGNKNAQLKILVQAKKQAGKRCFIDLDSNQWKYKLVEVVEGKRKEKITTDLIFDITKGF